MVLELAMVICIRGIGHKAITFACVGAREQVSSVEEKRDTEAIQVQSPKDEICRNGWMHVPATKVESASTQGRKNGEWRAANGYGMRGAR